MLRILVISLFVANLLLLVFQRDEPEARPASKPVPVEKKNTDIPTIHLFSEMIKDQELLSGNRRCFSLGPFHSSEDKDEVLLLLQEVSTRITERQTEALVEKGYWVFMPPYASLLEANQALISLQALGLEDIGVIYDGDWKNAISLGYFMRQENAQRRKKSVESKGYAPMIRVQRQSEPRYWLDYEQPPGSDLVVLDMQGRPNDFMQRSLPCREEVAGEPVITASQEPVQAIAQLREPGTDNQTGTDQGEEADDAGVDGAVQEGVETSPDTAVEPTGQEVADPGAADTVETEPESENALPPGDVEETGSGEADETGQEDTSGTALEGPDETGQENIIDTEPATVIEPGTDDVTGISSESVIETEPGDAENTALENAAESGEGEVIDSGAGNIVEPEPADSIEAAPGNAVGTGPESVIETEPESTENTALENAAESGEEQVIDSGQGRTVEPEPADNTGEANPGDAVGTGPPEGIGTEPEQPGETGTGEG